MASDRVFGLVVILVALAYMASALQIQTSFMSDPVGSKTFPLLIGAVSVLCGGVMVFKPDAEPDWPELRTLGSLALSVIVMVVYSMALKPLGFLIPTAITAAILSYQIARKPVFALLSGIGLAVVLFVIFRYALGLGLVPFPKV
ncbi:MAG: tripartite tricarboxylate transporter TctB family protein [Pseudomonadota bacterium]